MTNFSLDRSEILDSIQFAKENSEKEYVKCIQNLIQSRPFGDHKFYIYSFTKRVDDLAGVKKMYHQARLTKPMDALPGTTLMKVDPDYPEEATIVWTLPGRESMQMFSQGKMFENQFVNECITKYLTNPEELTRPDEDQLSDCQIKDIYAGIKADMKSKKRAEQSEDHSDPFN